MTFFGMALITAIATMVLAVLAIFTTVYAIRAYRAQSSQLKDQRDLNKKQTAVLKLQAQELEESLAERKREREQRSRAQASRVFVRQEHGPVLSTTAASAARGATGGRTKIAHLVNTSEQPIYDVMINWNLGDEPTGQCYLTPLMPGAEDKVTVTVPPKADPEQLEPVAFFRDAAGAHWRTTPDGKLTKQ